MNISELTGAALDWAVEMIECDGAMYAGRECRPFSTDWAQGGPIIEREGISLMDGWSAYTENLRNLHQGPTPLIAAMRCYVASQLGDEVDVPDELKGESK